MNVAPGGTDKTCCFYLPIICLIPTAASCVAVPSPSLSSRKCSICYCTYCRSDRVASKDDLIASIWGGRIVSDTTLTSRIKSARNAVGDRFLSARQRPQLAGSCDLLFDTVLELTRVEARPRTDQKAVGSAIPPHPAHTIGRIQARPIRGGYIINISGFDLW